MIKDLLNTKEQSFSMEVFPPKRDADLDAIYKTLDNVKELHPDFISVTYGAAGTTDNKTLEIASYVQNICKIEALAHLTCVAMNDSKLNTLIQDFKENKIENILALRGDRPSNMSDTNFNNRTYQHATDLIKRLKKENFCLGAACYPEKHLEAKSLSEDIAYLIEKSQLGANFFITQLFLDNNIFYNFMELCNIKGLNIPVLAGIMPITTFHQIETMIRLSGANLPDKLYKIMDKYKDKPEDFRKAGIDFAICQINELLHNKVKGIHLYSMNKGDISKEIYQCLDFN